ncbi:MAG TPA: hypothetical protein VGO80_23145 [Solirubrobacteraceae bacterium]|jgi:hypothetical protein|nr:hypothetical protein [Solirubrobacteraceae bacterium]
MSQHRSLRNRISVLLGAVVVAMGVGGPAAAQADDIEFLPRASLSVDAPNQLVGDVAKLHASADFINIASSPYWLKIYDETTQTFLTHCGFTNTCDVNVSQNVATQHTYRAYIAGSATTYKPPNVQAVSNDVVVRWGAKLVLNADTTQLFEDETANLTAKAAIAGTIAIKDATTGQTVKTCLAATVCSSPVMQPFPSTHKYFATQGALTSNSVGILWMKIPA